MPWNTPRLWSTGEHWTATLVNEQIRENLIALTPVVGELKMFMRTPTSVETVIGTNWLECNGAAVSRSSYSALYNLFNGMRSYRGTSTTTLTAAMDTTTTSMAITYYNVDWPGGRSTPHSSLLLGNPAEAAYPTGPFLVRVDNEIMLVTSKGSYPYLTLTVVRARESTLAASHSVNATVSISPDLPFSSGDGLTSFNLPDLHGRVPAALARSGGNAQVTAAGRSDFLPLSHRTTQHWHQLRRSHPSGTVEITFGGGGIGGQIDTSNWSGTPDTGYAGQPQAPNQNQALDGPAWLSTGVWGIRFVGV